jgi:tRNA pseudouridine55 synthase
MSSAHVVARIKRLFPKAKVGHAGTLDPEATGLLVVLLGRATKLATYAEGGEKEYAIEVLLGTTTTTDDIWGETIQESLVMVSEAEVRAGLGSFVGTIDQIPPSISAVKIDGERAYARARRGESVRISPRRVTIHAISDVQCDLPRVRIVVRCSKGTYMRSLARDLGQRLGCGACISAIRRTASSPFELKDAVPLAEVTSANLIQWDRLFPSAPRWPLTARQLARLRHGDETLAHEVSRSVPSSLDDASSAIVGVNESDAQPCALFIKVQEEPVAAMRYLWRLAVSMTIEE